ncbi:MAG: hypothetical protein KF774_17865 [Planctomyces sp.]|nr:hypothetical protein [Planctomyces sp.]
MTKPKSTGRNNRGGRPRGTPNREYPLAESSPSACRRCNSTFTAQRNKAASIPSIGEHQGKRHNLVTLHRVQCAHCGQWRMDRTYEFLPPGNPVSEFPGSTPENDAA